MKKILSLFLCLLLTFSITGCSSDDKKDEGSNDKTAEKDKTTEKEKEENKEPGIGETLEVEGLKITVNSVRTAEATLTKPKEGKEYFAIDITLENTTDEAYNSSSLISYELKNAEGRKQDLTLFANLNGTLDGEVAAGGKLAGEIAFEVDAGSEGLTLTFKPKVIGDSVTIKVR